LETFYFAISGYDRSPGLIVNAIDCLDLSGLDPEMRERDAALLAHQLEFILNRQDIPLYGVPDRPEGDRVVLEEVAGQPIVLARQADGLWRFDAETVGRIGRLRKLAAAASARPRRRAPGWPRAGPTRRRRSARSRRPPWAGATSPWPRGAWTSATSRRSSAPPRGRSRRGSWPS
jgi:hypothetical protein